MLDHLWRLDGTGRGETLWLGLGAGWFGYFFLFSFLVLEVGWRGGAVFVDDDDDDDDEVGG
jgi:hypothetical protein